MNLYSFSSFSYDTGLAQWVENGFAILNNQGLRQLHKTQLFSSGLIGLPHQPDKITKSSNYNTLMFTFM